jgi:hypothetical protein
MEKGDESSTDLEDLKNADWVRKWMCLLLGSVIKDCSVAY